MFFKSINEIMLNIGESLCVKNQLCLVMIGAYGILTHFDKNMDTNKLFKDSNGQQDVCLHGSRHLGCGRAIGRAPPTPNDMIDGRSKLPADHGFHANVRLSTAIVTVYLRTCLELVEI